MPPFISDYAIGSTYRFSLKNSSSGTSDLRHLTCRIHSQYKEGDTTTLFLDNPRLDLEEGVCAKGQAVVILASAQRPRFKGFSDGVTSFEVELAIDPTIVY